jgi:putative DNA primase/helicase
MVPMNIPFNAVRKAQVIKENFNVIYCANDFYIYESGCYRKWHEQRIFKLVKGMIEQDFSSHKAEEIIKCLKADSYVDTGGLNNTLYLNVLNGLFDINSFELLPHAPEVLSIIQLQVSYNLSATCPKWLKTLEEIFEGDQEKITLLQEFIGLCLTTETKFEKALFLLGDGANGKSVILFILQCLLGEDNYSAIPLEKFGDYHYLANLFGKLANITIETNVKSSVYDSTFKAIVSGDTITADAKFKHPFVFRPHCKLIFALNNLPQVNDKTSAFFRRLLILRFNKVFTESEQNKNLKFELIKEIDGIFLWSLQGFKRLRERRHFEIPLEMKNEIEEYKKDNNNILLFVEDQCEFDVNFEISKDDLYQFYSDWCRKNSYLPSAKKKFGKELKKACPEIGEGREAFKRLWRGIRKIPLL